MILFFIGVDHWYFHRDIYWHICIPHMCDLISNYVATLPVSMSVWWYVCVCCFVIQNPCLASSFRKYAWILNTNLAYTIQKINRNLLKQKYVIFYCDKIPEAYAKLRAYFLTATLLWFQHFFIRLTHFRSVSISTRSPFQRHHAFSSGPFHTFSRPFGKLRLMIWLV